MRKDKFKKAPLVIGFGLGPCFCFEFKEMLFNIFYQAYLNRGADHGTNDVHLMHCSNSQERVRAISKEGGD